MTARTLVANITALSRDNSAAQVAANTPHVAGDYIAAGSIQTTNLQGILLQVNTGTTAGTLTVRATGNGNNVAGAAQVSPYPSSAVYALGAAGDLQVVFGTTAASYMVGPVSTDRFEQADGNLYLDWSTAAGVTFSVFQMPFVSV